MEEEKKEEIKKGKPKRSTKSKVITVMLCISFFCVLSILLFVIFGRDYLPFNQKEEPAQEQKQEEPKEERITYKTVDGKYEIQIASKDDKDVYNKAKELYEKDNNEQYTATVYDGTGNKKSIEGYILFNNNIIEISEITKDDNYALYSGDSLGEDGKRQGYYYFIVDLKSQLLVNPLMENKESYYEYYIFNGPVEFVKTQAGYYFKVNAGEVECENFDIYTTSWKKVGKIYYNDKLDGDANGVYVYSKDTKKAGICLEEKIKVDKNGNKIG